MVGGDRAVALRGHPSAGPAGAEAERGRTQPGLPTRSPPPSPAGAEAEIPALIMHANQRTRLRA